MMADYWISVNNFEMAEPGNDHNVVVFMYNGCLKDWTGYLLYFELKR